jgi:hypothetical protein
MDNVLLIKITEKDAEIVANNIAFTAGRTDRKLYCKKYLQFCFLLNTTKNFYFRAASRKADSAVCYAASNIAVFQHTEALLEKENDKQEILVCHRNLFLLSAIMVVVQLVVEQRLRYLLIQKP